MGDIASFAALCFRSTADIILWDGSPRKRFPEPINDDDKVLESSFVVSTKCLGEVAASVRASGPV